GVVTLHERVEQLGDGYGCVRCKALREVVSLEQLGDRVGSRDTRAFWEAQLPEPLAVVPHFGAIEVDHLSRLRQVRLGVAVDLVRREDRPLGRPPARIADTCCVVPDDQNAQMTFVLEGAHSLQGNRMTNVDIRRGDVDTELHSERQAEGELALELAFRQNINGVP